jgi:hypothetical protein
MFVCRRHGPSNFSTWSTSRSAGLPVGAAVALLNRFDQAIVSQELSLFASGEAVLGLPDEPQADRAAVAEAERRLLGRDGHLVVERELVRRAWLDEDEGEAGRADGSDGDLVAGVGARTGQANALAAHVEGDL